VADHRQLYLINAIVAPLLPQGGMNGAPQKDGPREPPPYNVREGLVTGAHAQARYHEDNIWAPNEGDWIEVDFMSVPSEMKWVNRPPSRRWGGKGKRAVGAGRLMNVALIKDFAKW
jgi:hypothetical protein